MAKKGRGSELVCIVAWSMVKAMAVWSLLPIKGWVRYKVFDTIGGVGQQEVKDVGGFVVSDPSWLIDELDGDATIKVGFVKVVVKGEVLDCEQIDWDGRMSALQPLFKRGKPELALYVKTDCLTATRPRHLNTVLSYLLDPTTSIDDCGHLDWLRWLISGGKTFEEFSKTVLAFDNATTCGLVWTADFVAYRCRTCGFSPCMSLCSDCFLAGNHTGHDFNMFRSQAGGACDCGNTSVMGSEGFCPKHGPNQTRKPSAPNDLMAVAEAMMPRLLFRLIQHMRGHSAHDPRFTVTLVLGDAEQFLQFLHQLSDMGAAMRKVFSDVMTDESIYEKLTQITDDSSEFDRRGFANYQAALKSLKCPAVPPEFRGKNFGLDSPLNHKTLLEELLFWTVKFEFGQKLVTLLLSILPIDHYKAAFTKAFMEHYSRISVALVSSSDQAVVRSRISSRVLHISVQLLSPESLAVSMMKRHNLLPIITGSLWYMMRSIRTLSPFNDGPGSGRHMVVDCAKEVLKDHCYWPINSDLNSVLSHREIGIAFLENEMLVGFWMKFIEVFQGMNLNHRELTQHVEYEPETYYAGFSAELEICASPLWALLNHCKHKDCLPLLLNMLRSVVSSLQTWFSLINLRPLSTPNPLQVSFHLPLHRYFAILLSHVIVRFNFPFNDLSLPNDVLQMIMAHPLQLHVAFYEIFSGMWVRNGLQIRGQAMTYIQCHFCNSMIDSDVFILQLCGSRLDPDYFVKTLLQRFHVSDLLTFAKRTDPKRIGFLEPEHQIPMLEGALTTLCMILGIRTKLGLPQSEVTRLEMVTLLCMGDRTHSQLMDAMPDKCDQMDQTKSFEPTLEQVSNYKAPNFEAGGGMQQGIYIPKDEIWESDFDPLYVMLRAIYRRDLQTSLDRYTKNIRKRHGGFKGSLWPPFRVPGDVHPEFKSLRNILHCRSMHGLIFALLYQAVKDKHLSDAVVYFTVYLLEMAVLIPSPKQCNIEISISEPRLDKQLDLWYSSADIFQNINQTIPRMSVSVFEAHEGYRVISARHHEQSDDLQLDSAPLLPDNQLMLQPIGQQMSSLTSMMDEASQSLSSHEHRTRQLRTLGISTEAKPSRSVETPVDESILSLLLKLHDKYAGKPHSYVPEGIRGVATEADMGSRVGDACFFIGKLLDNICRRSENSAGIVERAHREGVQAGKGKKKAGELDKEERRRKARERQKRLMEQFASKQKEFMEQASEDAPTEPESSSGEAASSSPSLGEVKLFDCCICNQSTASTDQRLVGLVANLQSTSILGNRRHATDAVHLPLREPEGTRGTCAEDFHNRFTSLVQEFEETSCLLSVNIGWRGGVHAQTCGHYVHLDCLALYIESLKTQSQSQSIRVGDGEFWCPTCRNLSNTALPIISDGGGAMVLAPPSDPYKLIKWIFHVMETRPIAPITGNSKAAMSTVMENLTKAAYPEFKMCTKLCTGEGVLIFVGSVLRTNLELELIQRGGSPCQQIKSSLASKKPCLLPLIHVLSLHSKILTGQKRPFVDLWSHVTGVSRDGQEACQSVTPYTLEVPLLLKDVSSLLIHLVLNMPSAIPRATYQCLVQALYNLQYVQALAMVSCRFSEEERRAWQRGLEVSSAKVTLESMLGHMISLLEESALFTDDASDVPAICQSVWSPLSVEMSVQEACLPFVRVASLLMHHLYDAPLPVHSQPEASQEFMLLCDYLNLHQSTPKHPSGCTRTQWHCDLLPLLRAWCQHFSQLVRKDASSARMLLSCPVNWVPPQLCHLPHLYDRIFQFYRSRSCQTCGNVPRDPAVCLVCGRLLCFKDRCCAQATVYECVQHSRSCGGGTGIFLIVNSSIIVVIQGPRATAWGSVYLDEHGEEDHYLKRGKPLYLCKERYQLLQDEWLSHSFVRVCKKWIMHIDTL
ncbi:hypothetical protein CAPTEDRAFT_220674 [Capitella teleta]|uniref:E3 ubiquitin-protein ligase n=1 Tax=Capitella teleta TaxID=283909 RepID=R7UWL9_CAPTE|nr:hypothetical protein CAPTEDRAFT_220674 [Capitella teleta]|eukprot:ELU10689.1 hypothetical protein CAPTEDRAFT_220674 [Capitella teleta]